MKKTDKCNLTDDEMLDYVRGIADQKTITAVDNHVKQCPDCFARIEELSNMTHILTGYGPSTVDPPEHHLASIIAIAEQAARKTRTNKTTVLDRLKGVFDYLAPSSWPMAFASVLCVFIIVGVVSHINRVGNTDFISLNRTDRIDFPQKTRSGSEVSKNDQVRHWHYIKVTARFLQEIYTKQTPETIHTFIREITSKKDAVKPIPGNQNTISLLEKYAAQSTKKHHIALQFEKNLIRRLETADPEKIMIICMGFSANDALVLAFGSYNRWLYDDLKEIWP